LVEHDTGGDGCVCGPGVVPVMRTDGSVGWLLIHHSLDGRELAENQPKESSMTALPAWLLAALRTGIQSGWGWLAAHVSILAMLPANVVTNAIVEFVATVVIIGGATAALRWLETRKGDGWFSIAARGLAKVLMLGLSRRQPVYAPPSSTVRVDGAIVAR